MSHHIPVLPEEVLDWLLPAERLADSQRTWVAVDGTLGGGGHTRMFAQRLPDAGRVITFDRDPLAVAAFQQAWQQQPIGAADAVTAIAANFADIPQHLQELNIESVDCVLLDLGLSSDQLDDMERGFSYRGDGPLDMRFNTGQGEPAWKLLERLSEKHLADLIFQYGEERHSRRVARAIVEQRRKSPIQTVLQLAELVRRCVPRSRNHSIDPATRTFQALRIAVNEELKWVESAARQLPNLLAPGGRIGIISFHSLEDRIVKNEFREHPLLKVLTRKPVRPTEREAEQNPRSRSSKFRVAERVAADKS